MFLWSQSVSSLKLIIGFGYILILGYFLKSNVFGCGFDLLLWASKFGFYGIELDSKVFCHFF